MSGRFLTRVALASCFLVASLAGGSAAPQTYVNGREVSPKEIAARRAELQKILDQYLAGNLEIISTAFRQLDVGSADSRAVTRSALRDLLRDKAAKWHRGRAAFAIEIAAIWSAGVFYDGDTLTTYVRELLASRPTPIGESAGEDRFELLCHQIALGLLESSGNWLTHHNYLAATSPRFVKLEAQFPNSNRIPLMRAMDAAMHCCSKELAGKVIPLVTVFYGATPPPAEDPSLAVLLFEQASVNPALRQEALVRAAFVQEKYGKVAEGLALIDRATSPGDPILDYAAALVRGGLLDRAGQPAAAAESYAAAVRIGPGAQIPAIGLAAALQRAGRVDEAVEAAERARRMPTNGFDPWPTFLRADARFVGTWVLQMREMLR